jgi:hypothetical protein
VSAVLFRSSVGSHLGIRFGSPILDMWGGPIEFCWGGLDMCKCLFHDRNGVEVYAGDLVLDVRSERLLVRRAVGCRGGFAELSASGGESAGNLRIDLLVLWRRDGVGDG